MSSSLHDTDLVAWAQQSAALLRDGAELDPEEREQIAMELYDMASSTRRELKTRAVTLIMHMLKIKFQPQKQSRSWEVTVANQRRELDAVLEESPSLYSFFEEQLPKLYASARREAQLETGLDIFPAQSPFTLEQILRG